MCASPLMCEAPHSSLGVTLSRSINIANQFHESDEIEYIWKHTLLLPYESSDSSLCLNKNYKNLNCTAMLMCLTWRENVWCGAMLCVLKPIPGPLLDFNKKKKTPTSRVKNTEWKRIIKFNTLGDFSNMWNLTLFSQVEPFSFFHCWNINLRFLQPLTRATRRHQVPLSSRFATSTPLITNRLKMTCV